MFCLLFRPQRRKLVFETLIDLSMILVVSKEIVATSVDVIHCQFAAEEILAKPNVMIQTKNRVVRNFFIINTALIYCIVHQEGNK